MVEGQNKKYYFGKVWLVQCHSILKREYMHKKFIKIKEEKIMLKKIISAILTAAMLASMGTTVFASEQESIPENTTLVESGEVVIPAGVRSSFTKYVGEQGRGGYWKHGVLGATVYSNLSTNDYFNKVSVRPFLGATYTSDWSIGRGQFVSVDATTSYMDGNRAFYDLRD